MFPKFKIDKWCRLYIGTPDGNSVFHSNGHWLVTGMALKMPKHVKPKALEILDRLKPGTYLDGYGYGLSGTDTPDMAAIIPKRDGYKPVNSRQIGVKFRGESDEILAYRFQGEGFEIGFAVEYVPLLRMGTLFAKDEKSPAIILAGDTLNDELLAVVMPLRLT